MTYLAAFDAKEFSRVRYREVPNPSNPEETIQKVSGFYSPLGCGIITRYPDILEESIKNAFDHVGKMFGLNSDMPFMGSHEIKMHFNNDMSKTIAFADNVVKNIQDYLEYTFFTYIVLPPSEIPTINVGGEKSPKKEIETYKFLRNCAPAFSALTAWAFAGKHKSISETRLLIDSFRYKKMTAWEQLIKKTKPEVYPHGDECNPFIALADIIAFLTDVKLYKMGKTETKYRRLTPEGIRKAWEEYAFDSDIWFLNKSGLGLFVWHRDELIDLKPFIKRPVVFFLADRIETLSVVRSPEAPDKKDIPPERRFNRQIRNFPAFRAATKYAYYLGGSIQLYDPFQDARLVQDGDVIVYMGDNSKKIAKTLSDAYDIKIIRAKDLRKKVKETKEE